MGSKKRIRKRSPCRLASLLKLYIHSKQFFIFILPAHEHCAVQRWKEEMSVPFWADQNVEYPYQVIANLIEPGQINVYILYRYTHVWGVHPKNVYYVLYMSSSPNFIPGEMISYILLFLADDIWWYDDYGRPRPFHTFPWQRMLPEGGFTPFAFINYCIRTVNFPRFPHDFRRIVQSHSYNLRQGCSSFLSYKTTRATCVLPRSFVDNTIMTFLGPSRPLYEPGGTGSTNI